MFRKLLSKFLKSRPVEVIYLTPEELARVLDLLENPPEPTEAYLKAKASYEKLIRKSAK